MKDLIRSMLLIVAIYSGAIAVNSHGYVLMIGAIVCGLACCTFVEIKDNKKD